MGILRSDLLTHSQLSNEGGSIVLDGSGDYLSFAAHSAFAPATSDVTFELWFYLNADSNFNVDSADSNYYFFDMGSNGYRIQMYSGLIRFGIDGSTWTPPASGVSKTKWHHVAGVREGNSLDLYLDGKHVGQKSTTASVTSTSLTIGQYGGNLSYNGVPHGYISNFRYVRGVVYRGEFTPPKFELKNIPGTIVLGCQSTSSATDFAVTPSTISVGGNTAASSFHPGLKKDITDTGVVFDGFGNFATSTYMVPPKGKKTERNRGRALLGGGHNGSTHTNHIHQLSIQSQGNTEEFGDLTNARWIPAPSSSPTRGVWSGGGGPSPGSPTGAYVNFIDFVTIANSSNATDFGDMTAEKGYHAGLSNETRGIIAGGYNDSVGKIDVIEFITIATAGNAQDFGDLTAARMQFAAAGSPTRGLFFGGVINPNVNGNVVDFITIATTGNAQDFGDMTAPTRYGNATSSNTRAIYGGGLAPDGSTYTNKIEFFTIASAGNGTDFGDLTTTRSTTPGATSNNIRGIFAGGYVPGNVNSIDFVTIATIGNASDFGDLTYDLMRGIGALSDSHGGLE